MDIREDNYQNNILPSEKISTVLSKEFAPYLVKNLLSLSVSVCLSVSFCLCHSLLPSPTQPQHTLTPNRTKLFPFRVEPFFEELVA